MFFSVGYSARRESGVKLLQSGAEVVTMTQLFLHVKNRCLQNMLYD